MSEAPVGSRGGVGPSTCQMTSSCCMALAAAAGLADVCGSYIFRLSYMLWTGLGGNYMKGHRWVELNECYSDTTRAICDTNFCTEGATCVTPQSHQSVAHDLRNGVSGRQRHPYRVCVRRRARPLYSFISSTGVWGGRRSSMLSASAARRRSEARAALAACCSRRSSRTWLGFGSGSWFGSEFGLVRVINWAVWLCVWLCVWVRGRQRANAG